MKNYLKKIKVSVAISAYNEEKNMVSLLKSILEQRNNNFILKKIIVISDGSTDNTNIILKKISKHTNKIKIYIYKKRRGKAYRLQEIYSKAKTDVLVTIDADVKLKDPLVIDKLIKPFRDDRVRLVFGNALPSDPINFFQKIVVTYENFWKKTTNQINKGNNIHNCVGCILALRINFYTKLSFPESLVAEDHFIYLSAAKRGFKRVFVNDAIVYFNSPKTSADYLRQFQRYFSSQSVVEDHFGRFAENFYNIPVLYKLKAYQWSFLESPIYMFFALVLQVYQRLKMKPDNGKNIFWETVLTSK